MWAFPLMASHSSMVLVTATYLCGQPYRSSGNTLSSFTPSTTITVPSFQNLGWAQFASEMLCLSTPWAHAITPMSTWRVATSDHYYPWYSLGKRNLQEFFLTVMQILHGPLVYGPSTQDLTWLEQKLQINPRVSKNLSGKMGSAYIS